MQNFLILLIMKLVFMSVTSYCQFSDQWFREFQRDMVNFEGLKINPYEGKDGASYIGIGHKILAGEKFTELSGNGVNTLFRKDFNLAYKRAVITFPSFEEYPKKLKFLVLHMLMAHGYTGFAKYKNFIKAVKEKDWELAGESFEASYWYKHNKKLKLYYKWEEITLQLKEQGLYLNPTQPDIRTYPL